MLGGLEWEGLDVAIEIHGASDVEQVVRHLVTIRDFQARKQDS